MRVVAAALVLLLALSTAGLLYQRSTISDLRSDLRTEKRETAKLQAATLVQQDQIETLRDALGEQQELGQLVTALAGELDHCVDGMRLVTLEALKPDPDIGFVEEVGDYCENAQRRNADLREYANRTSRSS